MVRTALIRRAVSYGTAAMMTCFGLTGVVSAQTITNTGNGSTNTITSTTTDNCTVTNNNTVSATSNNNQSAVSGDTTSSGNTVASLPWTGWSALDPASAQANGQSYDTWFNGIINWVSNRSSGAGWNSNQSNLSWTPGAMSWNAFDPMTWQANGQSFGNWYNALQAYMNSNSSTWALTWNSTGDSAGAFGDTTGDATNVNHANFSININNAARAVAGTNSCGQSLFTPPPTVGGMGGGPTGSSYTPSVSRSYSPRTVGGSGGGYSGGSSQSYWAPSRSSAAPAQTAASAPAPSVGSSAPSAPSTPSTPAPSAPSNTISYTGNGSTNTISHTSSSNYQVTNNNNVSATSNNNQTAVTGSSSSSGNTVGAGSGTGAASNGNSAATGADVTN